MVRVRVTEPGRVYHDGRIQPAGAELEVPVEFAEAWERAGVAEIVAPAAPEPEELAVEPEPEGAAVEPEAEAAEPAPVGPAEQATAEPGENKERPQKEKDKGKDQRGR